MRHFFLALAGLALLAGCSGKGSTDAGLKDGVDLQLDQTRLTFGGYVGNAVLLGTKPANTLQLISDGKKDLTIQKVEITSGTDKDGGALNTPSAFSFTGPAQKDIPGGQVGFVQVVFAPPHQGHFGALLRITSNAPGSESPMDVALTGDCVTPMVSVVSGDGGTDITLPPVTLYPRTDGGTDYATVYESSDVWFSNPGTFQLQFQPAGVANDAGTDSPLSVCTNAIQGGTGTVCQPGPLPNTLDRAYPDGGLSLRILPDAGYGLDLARMSVVFAPNLPGSYTGHIIVDSTATNQPEIVFTVHGTATAP